jgi:hypothetical protein
LWNYVNYVGKVEVDWKLWMLEKLLRELEQETDIQTDIQTDRQTVLINQLM